MNNGSTPLVVCVVTAALAALLPGSARSMPSPGGAWLDSPSIHNWNKIAEHIPRPPAPSGDPATEGRCARTVRPASTREDRAVVAAGWKLYRPYQLYATTSFVGGMASVDGMCRPLQYNVFVFSNAVFAGTLSPVLMNSREDGALVDATMIDSSTFSATFARYRAQDPLCCPTRASTLEYSLISSHAHPLVVPQETSTTPAR